MTKPTLQDLGRKLEYEGFEYIFDLGPESIPEEIMGDFILAKEYYNALFDALYPYMDGE